MNDAIVVFSAEFARRLRSRPFLAGLVIGVIFILLMFRLPMMLERMSGASAKRLIVVGAGDLGVRAAKLLSADFTIAATLSGSKPNAGMLRSHDADNIVRITARNGSLSVTIFAKNPGSVPLGAIRRDLLPLQLQQVTKLPSREIASALTIPIDVRALASRFGSSHEEDAVRGAVFAMLFLLYITVLLNSQLIMSSVAEEKTSRVAELLIAAIDPAALLAGKIAAGTALALVQLALWIGCSFFLGSDSGNATTGAPGVSGLSDLLNGGVLSPLTIGAFFGFFLIGLLQLSTMFAAIASMINRTEDIGSMSLPLIFPVVVAVIVALGAIDAPDAPVAVVTSFLPLFAPFVMFARIAVGIVPAWQIALSFTLNVAALAAICWGAGRIYRVGMLFYGRAPSFRQIWKALRVT